MSQSAEHIENIEAFCAQVRDGLGNATFGQKRQLIDMLDVRGKLAIANDEKVVYVKWILGQQLLSVARTSPSSNVDWQNSVELTARFVLGRGISLAEVLFAGKTRTKQIT